MDGVEIVDVPMTWCYQGGHWVGRVQCPKCSTVAGVSGDGSALKHLCRVCFLIFRGVADREQPK